MVGPIYAFHNSGATLRRKGQGGGQPLLSLLEGRG